MEMWGHRCQGVAWEASAEKESGEEQLKLDQERMCHKNKEKHLEERKVAGASGRSNKTSWIGVHWILPHRGHRAGCFPWRR